VESCVIPMPVPAWGGTVVNVNTSAEMASAITNATSGQCINGGGGTFTLDPTISVNASDIRISNATIQSSGDAAVFMNVNGSDVEFIDVTLDMQNQSIGRVIVPNGPRFVFVRSVIRDVNNTDTSTNSAIYPRSDDVYIVCSRFENLISANAPVRAIHWDGVSVNGGIVANNDFINLQANNPAWDADAIVFQNLPGNQFNSKLQILGNRGLDMGKRFVKLQAGNVDIIGNDGHWDSTNGPLGYRHRRAMFDDQGYDNVLIKNNYAISDYDEFGETTFGYGMASQRGFVADNKHIVHNVYEVNMTSNNPATDNYFIVYRDWQQTAGDYPTNSSITNNAAIGSGSLNHVYFDRDTADGNDFQGMTFSGNTSAVAGVEGLTRNT